MIDTNYLAQIYTNALNSQGTQLPAPRPGGFREMIMKNNGLEVPGTSKPEDVSSPGKDMTLEEYKQYLYKQISQIPIHPTRSQESRSITITDAGFQALNGRHPAAAASVPSAMAPYGRSAAPAAGIQTAWMEAQSGFFKSVRRTVSGKHAVRPVRQASSRSRCAPFWSRKTGNRETTRQMVSRPPICSACSGQWGCLVRSDRSAPWVHSVLPVPLAQAVWDSFLNI